MNSLTMRFGAALALAVPVFLALPGPAAFAQDDDAEPSFIRGLISRTHYDGITNDLLTAGLGQAGLATGAPTPTFADPTKPTAEELRRLAIFTNYRALVDTTAGGGYGVLYGPSVTAEGQVTDSKGLIAGDEFIAFADDASGTQRVTMMVQVPDSFDPDHPCIVTAPSSGSRGVYGAIATAGEWRLKHNCAVVYTDKGTGTGAHDLQNDTVNLIRGERADAAAAGDESNFTADLSDAERNAFDAESPNRFAFKHAHSQQNPEKDWGQDVLRSIEFAFFVLNQEFSPRSTRGKGGRPITKNRTLVIASSVSNGGGASILAAEQDERRLIDGLAVSEPNVNPVFDDRFTIVQDGRDPVVQHSRPLYDYVTLLNVFEGCAGLDPANAGAPLNTALSQQRCASLHAQGLLQSSALDAQAAEALRIINDYGILPEQNIVAPSHWTLYVPQAIAVTYANAYGRFSVADNLCGYSFGATDPGTGAPTPLAAAAEAALFSTSNGIPPTGGINLINNQGVGGPKEDRLSTPDQDLRGALCLRALATGTDPASGSPLGGQAGEQNDRIAQGIAAIRATGDLHRIPAVIVTGRNDANLAPNHTSRAYFGLNNVVDGGGSQLRYYEVTNAQHLDTLNALPGFNARFIPLHRYFIQAMDLMYDHLRNGAALPPSQVVHTVPRGTDAAGTVPPIGVANVPPIDANPPADRVILFTGNEVRIPD